MISSVKPATGAGSEQGLGVEELVSPVGHDQLRQAVKKRSEHGPATAVVRNDVDMRRQRRLRHEHSTLTESGNRPSAAGSPFGPT